MSHVNINARGDSRRAKVFLRIHLTIFSIEIKPVVFVLFLSRNDDKQHPKITFSQALSTANRPLITLQKNLIDKCGHHISPLQIAP